MEHFGVLSFTYVKTVLTSCYVYVNLMIIVNYLLKYVRLSSKQNCRALKHQRKLFSIVTLDKQNERMQEIKWEKGCRVLTFGNI